MRCAPLSTLTLALTFAVASFMPPASANYRYFTRRDTIIYVGRAQFPSTSTKRSVQDLGPLTASVAPHDDTFEGEPGQDSVQFNSRARFNVRRHRRSFMQRQRRGPHRVKGVNTKSNPPVDLLPTNVRNPNKTLVPVAFDGIDAVTVRTCGTGKYSMTNGFAIPADAAGCAGSGYIVQTTNFAIAVYTKTGKVVAGPIPLYQFFGTAPNLNTSEGTVKPVLSRLVDPSCIYDRDSKRFYLSVLHRALSPANPWTKFQMFKDRNGAFYPGIRALVLAVSSPGDPKQHWNTFLIPVRNDGVGSTNDTAPPLNYDTPPFQADYPQISVDKFGVYITTMAQRGDGTALAHTIYALSKKAVASSMNTTALRWTFPLDNEPNTRGFIYPTQATADSRIPFDFRFRGTMLFLVSDFGFSNSYLSLFALVNTAALRFPFSTSGSFPRIRLLQAQAEIDQQNQVFDVLQKEGHRLQANSEIGPARPISAVATGEGKGRRVWATWMACADSDCDLGLTPRSAAPVVRLAPRFTRSRRQGLTLSVDVEWYQTLRIERHSILFPHITFNGKGQGLLAFSVTGEDFHPSSAFLRITSKGLLDSVVFMPAVGRAPLNDSSGKGGTARFGDYQAAGVDESGNFWAVLQYVRDSGIPDEALVVNNQYSNWATRLLTIKWS